MRFPFSSLLLVLFLSACSAPVGTGVWKAVGENDWGIQRMVVGFEGRAEFVSTKNVNAIKSATWHCFWSKAGDFNGLLLQCTASTNTEEKRLFWIMVNDKKQAELLYKGNLIATFSLVDENPSPRKK